MGFVDLTGKRFGKLVVLKRGYSPSRDPDIFWLCQCDCGNLNLVRGKALKRTKSCGCLRADLYAEKLRSQKWNDITFVELANKTQTERFGVFECHCGNRFTARCGNVVDGHTKSCGCLVKKRTKTAKT